jgi:hypothetical protein
LASTFPPHRDPIDFSIGLRCSLGFLDIHRKAQADFENELVDSYRAVSFTGSEEVEVVSLVRLRYAIQKQLPVAPVVMRPRRLELGAQLTTTGTSPAPARDRGITSYCRPRHLVDETRQRTFSIQWVAGFERSPALLIVTTA